MIDLVGLKELGGFKLVKIEHDLHNQHWTFWYERDRPTLDTLHWKFVCTDALLMAATPGAMAKSIESRLTKDFSIFMANEMETIGQSDMFFGAME